MSPIDQALHAVVDFLDEHGLAYAIVGGIAAGLWGQPRTTFDVDAVVAAETETLDRLRNAIRPPPFLFEPKMLTFPTTKVLRGHVLEHTNPDEPGVIVVDFLTFEPVLNQSIMNRRQRANIGGRDCWLCSPEDLILLKLLAGRVKDLEDIKGILAERQEKLDQTYLQDWIARLGKQAEWARVLAEPITLKIKP